MRWRSLVFVRARLVLTRSRISLTPEGLLGRLVREEALDMPLSDVWAVAWQGLSLSLETATGRLRLSGPPTSAVYACLGAMGVPDQPDERGGAGWSPVERVVDATQYRPPLQFAGKMAFSQLGVFFQPGGAVERAVAVPEVAIPMAEIRGVWEDQGALIIDAGQDPLRFEILDAHRFIRRLVDVMATAPLSPDDAAPRRPAVVVARLKAWGIGELAPGDVVLSVPCVVALDGDRALRVEAVLLRARGLLLVPEGAPVAGQELLARALVHVQRSCYRTLDGDIPGAVSISDGTSPVVVRFRGGEPIAARFRDAAMGLPLEDGGDIEAGGALRRLRGPVRYTRIMSRHSDAVSFRPGWVIQEENGIGLVFTHAVVWPNTAGIRVRVEVGVQRGVYRVDGRIKERWSADAETLGINRERYPGIDATDPLDVVILALSKHADVLYRRSRREWFRVSTTEDIRFTPFLPGTRTLGRALRGALLDLSAGGCAIGLASKLETGAHGEVRFSLLGRRVEMRVEVVHSSKQVDDRYVWRHGLRFVALDASGHTRVQKEVLRREKLGRQREDDADA